MMEGSLTLTTQELEEIKILKEGSIGMSVDGVDVTCFDLLFDVFTNEININTIPREELLHSYKQFKSNIEFWEAIPYVDNNILYNIERKIRAIFINEIQSRK